MLSMYTTRATLQGHAIETETEGAGKLAVCVVCSRSVCYTLWHLANVSIVMWDLKSHTGVAEGLSILMYKAV
jgi:hypothetical protein